MNQNVVRRLHSNHGTALCAVQAVLSALEGRLAGLVELGAGAAEPYQLACFAPGPASRGYVRHVDEPRCDTWSSAHRIVCMAPLKAPEDEPRPTYADHVFGRATQFVRQ